MFQKKVILEKPVRLRNSLLWFNVEKSTKNQYDSSPPGFVSRRINTISKSIQIPILHCKSNQPGNVFHLQFVRAAVTEAISCHFDDSLPKIILLHFVREEVFAIGA